MSAALATALEKIATAKKVNTVAARRMLTDPGSSALALLVSARTLAGPEWHEWEPETVWLSLDGKGIEVPNANRAKIMAAWTIGYVPSFYWDGVVFEKTALAFDGHEPNPETLEEANSAQLAWAVLEAAHVCQYFEETPHDFEHEPRAYAAVVLHREGFVVAPTQLDFAQEQLDKNNTGLDDLKSKVRDRWSSLDKKQLPAHFLGETHEDVQLARLAAVELHVQEREQRAAEELRALYES